MRIPDGKITIPQPPADFVPRPAVRNRLDEAGATRLALVSAPAGYGKSALLSDWARRQPTPVAWVTLDAADNDRLRLWTVVRAALEASGAGMPTRSAEVSREGVDLLDEILWAIEDDGRALVLVLDDVQELTSPDALRDLERLVRLRPPGLRLVLSSRVDPPLGLPRIRLEGRLYEVRAEHLRFSRADADAMLRASGINLSADQLEILLRRTDGWTAGLRLAALSLRRSDDPDRFLAAFSGDERSVADYLTGEMLSLLDQDTLDFLRVVSVCSTLSTDLAMKLSGRQDAGLVLDRMRREAALIGRAGSDEYAIHALLRSYLRADLQRRGHSRYRAVEAAASRWWAEHGDAAHALRHAERSADAELMGELLCHFGVLMLLRGELEPLRRGLAATGTGGRHDDPALALLATVAHLELRSRDAAAVELEHARRSWPPVPDPELVALRTSAELLGGALNLTGAGDTAGPTPVDEVRPEVAALLHFGRGAHALLRGTDPAEPHAELEQALTLARGRDLPFLEVHCLTLLAGLAALHGDQQTSMRCAQEALRVVAAHGGTPASAWAAAPSAVLAYAELLAGDGVGAAERVARTLAVPDDQLVTEVAFVLHAVRAAARADRGEGVAGLAEAQAARARLDGNGGRPEWYAALAVLEHRSALMLGNPGAATAVVDWLRRRAGGVAEVRLMRAWTEAAAGRHEAAAIAALEGEDTPVLLAHTPLEVLLVQVEAALQRGDGAEARATLGAALATGRSLGVVRPFALAGRATRAALVARRRQAGRDEFLARIEAALSVVRPEIAAPLSEREYAVLALLPSLLTAREIAVELTVSVNTVKTHIRSIYLKLGVASRRDAVQRAKDRGLLT